MRWVWLFIITAPLLVAQTLVQEVHYPWERDHRCTLVPDGGMCKGYFEKYFYNPKTQKCDTFVYGGCDGVVPFESMEECIKACEYRPSIPVKKPALYLYPPKSQKVRVRLAIDGNLTYSLPPYAQGWDVRATPSGRIDGKWDYLFYEVDLRTLTLPQQGWVISAAELAHWCDTTLPRLGLNPKERAQFKEYWLHHLTSHPYYAIYLLDREFVDEHMRLIIEPKPTHVTRLIFYFAPLSSPITLPEPMIQTPVRRGFSVIEWGGITP